MLSVADFKLTLQLYFQMSNVALPLQLCRHQTGGQIMNTPPALSPDVPSKKAGEANAPGGFLKISPTLLGATMVAALGGLLFGFDTIVISGCQTQLKGLFQLDSFQQGFMTASAIIGTVCGALIAARPGDRYGRRDSLDRKSTRLNSSHQCLSRMPSSA